MEKLSFAAVMGVLLVGFASARAAPPARPSAVHPLEGGDICAALLGQGIRDIQSTNISESRFNEVHAEVCNANYDSYSKAHAQSESGGLDVPGYFGVSASSANSDLEYSTKWSNFCSADYGKATSDSQVKTFLSTINVGILHSFDHCVDVNSERFIRYVQPDPGGATFEIVFKNRREGVSGFTIDQLTIKDTTQSRTLDPTKDCDLPHRLPFNTGDYNAITILCSKPVSDNVVVNGRTTAGLIDPVTVAGILTAPPSVADRVTALEGEVSGISSRVVSVGSSISQVQSTLPQSVLAALPQGTVLLSKSPLPVPAGWTDCPDGDHFLRVSPNGARGGVPGPGGSADLSQNLDNNGFTYDGGHPADPGRDSRRSPPSGEHLSIPMPEFTYVACMMKQ